jgi:hypothetical protein
MNSSRSLLVSAVRTANVSSSAPRRPRLLALLAGLALAQAACVEKPRVGLPCAVDADCQEKGESFPSSGYLCEEDACAQGSAHTAPAAVAISFDVTPAATTAGVAVAATVTATNKNHNPKAGFTGPVTLSAMVGALPASVSPTSVNLVDGVAKGVQVTITTAGVVAVTASVTGATSAPAAIISVAPGAPAGLSVAAANTPSAQAGVKFAGKVYYTDSHGNVAAGVARTVTFGTPDDTNAATSPSSVQFAIGDGAKAFEVAFAKPLVASHITATDGTLTAPPLSVQVVPGPVASFTLVAPAVVTSGEAFTATSTAFDAKGNPAVNYSGTLHFTSGDAQAAVPGNQTVPVTAQGVLAMAGFVLKTLGTQSVTVADASNPAASGSASVKVAPVPVACSISAAPTAAPGSVGNVASTVAVAGMTYQWTVNGAAVSPVPAAPGNQISFTAGAAGTTLTLGCTAVNEAGKASSPVMKTVVVGLPALAISVPAIVTAGDSVAASVPAASGRTYAWMVKDGSGATVASGAGSTSGGSNTFMFTAPGATTLTISYVETDTGSSATGQGSTSVAVAPLPVPPVLTAPANATANQSGLAASVSNANGALTYNWSITGGTFSGGGTTATGTSVTFSVGASGSAVLSCVAVNAANKQSAAGTATVPIGPQVQAPSFVTVCPLFVTVGDTGIALGITARSGFTYQWTPPAGFTLNNGATGTTVNGVNSAVFDAGGASQTVNFSVVEKSVVTGATSGASACAVNVVAAPVVTGFTTSATGPLAVNATTTLTATFSGGTGVIDNGVTGSITSGSAVLTQSLKESTTFTLVVTNTALRNAVWVPAVKWAA